MSTLRAPISFETVDILHDKRPLFHCISEDLHMGRGLARQVREQVGGLPLIRAQDHSVGKAVPVEINNMLVWHLVTKKRYHHKPSLWSLRLCLLDLRDKMKSMGMDTIKAPMYVACNRDRLPWAAVLQMIDDILSKSNIHVILCGLPGSSASEGQKR